MFKLKINGKTVYETVSRSDIREAARMSAHGCVPVRITKQGKPCLGLMAQAGLLDKTLLPETARRIFR